MPAGLVQENDSMRVRRDQPRNLLQMQAHALGRAAGQDQAGAFALGRADCPEDVGRGRPLVLGGRGAGATQRPAACNLVLLADAGLVGEPDLYRLAAHLGFRDLRQTAEEVFMEWPAPSSRGLKLS